MTNFPTSDVRFDRRSILALILAGGAWIGVAGVVDAADDPAAFISEVGAKTTAILNDTGLSSDVKLARLKAILDESTDLDLVAKLILGPHWRKATPEERSEYIKVFRDLVMETMATSLHDYGGETFEVVDSKKVNDTDSVVSTRITRPSGGEPIRVDWRVRQADGAFLIIDVTAEGVSLVVSQRSEVNGIINREGIEGLIANMRERTARGGVTATGG